MGGCSSGVTLSRYTRFSQQSALHSSVNHGPRRTDTKEERSILRRATRATTSKSGKALLRRRGEFLERGFCHVLDHGGMRHASLRGRANLSKRYVVAALSFNLSLLVRTLFGIGTPKQWLAKGKTGQKAFLGRFLLSFEQFSQLSGSPITRWYRQFAISPAQNPC